VTPAETSIATKMGQRDRDDDDEEEEDDNDEDNKRVRFDQVSAAVAAATGTDSSTSSESPSKRGLVSRRGGRLASPGRALTSASPVNKEAAAAAAAVLEFKTYRSPERKAQGDMTLPPPAEAGSDSAARQEEGSDAVPSLCSTNSMKEEEEEETDELPKQNILMNNENSCSSRNNNTSRVGSSLPKASMLQPKPSSRQYETTRYNNNRANQVPSGSRENGKTKIAGPGISVGGPKKSSVTFSPVPTPKESMDHRVGPSRQYCQNNSLILGRVRLGELLSNFGLFSFYVSLGLLNSA
jgi:hypothetical protein